MWNRSLMGMRHMQLHRGFNTASLILVAESPFLAYSVKSFLDTVPIACSDCNLSSVKSMWAGASLGSLSGSLSVSEMLRVSSESDVDILSSSGCEFEVEIGQGHIWQSAKHPEYFTGKKLFCTIGRARTCRLISMQLALIRVSISVPTAKGHGSGTMAS